MSNTDYWDAINTATQDPATTPEATTPIQTTTAPVVSGWSSGSRPTSSDSMGLSGSGVTSSRSGDTASGLSKVSTVTGLIGAATQDSNISKAGGIIGTASRLSNDNVSNTDKAVSVGQLAAGLSGNMPLGLAMGGWAAVNNGGISGGIQYGASTLASLALGVPGAIISGISGLLGGPTIGSVVRNVIDGVDDHFGISDGAKEAQTFNSDVASISGVDPKFGVADSRTMGAGFNGDPDGSRTTAENNRLANGTPDAAPSVSVGGWSLGYGNGNGATSGGYSGAGMGGSVSSGSTGSSHFG